MVRSKKRGRKGKAAAVMCVIFVVCYLYVQHPVLVVPAVITMISLTSTFLWVRRRRRHRVERVLFEMGVHNLDVMDGIAFEQFLGALFQRLGYLTDTTRTSGDYGVDVLLRKGKQRIAVQAKHYSTPVGLSAVQEVHAGIKFYGADEGWVVTNNTFTRAARELAGKTGVRLIDGAELRRLVESAAGAL